MTNYNQCPSCYESVVDEVCPQCGHIFYGDLWEEYDENNETYQERRQFWGLDKEKETI